MIGPAPRPPGRTRRQLRRTLRQRPPLRDEHDVYHQCLTFAAAADQAGTLIEPLRQRYGGTSDWQTRSARRREDAARRSPLALPDGTRCRGDVGDGPPGGQSAARRELKDVASSCHTEAETQAKWFLTRIKTGAPQALVVG